MRVHLFSCLCLFLIAISISASYLDTQSKTVLSLNEFLVSPLGFYRLRVLNNCSLQLQAFNTVTNQYSQQEVFDPSKDIGRTCNSLQLSLNQRSLLRNDGSIYQKFSNNLITRLVVQVNDNGDVNVLSFLNGAVDGSQALFIVNPIRQSKSQSRFVYDLQRFMKYQNKNGWVFQSNQGLITLNNPNINLGPRTVNLTNKFFKKSGFIDSQGQLRYSAIPGLTMRPRADVSRCGKPPQSVFAEFDEYWPIIRIYDRDKYLLAQYKIDENINSFCPQKTFLYLDRCDSTCPDPYFKQIRGKYGYCTLNCQSGSIIDQRKRLCSSKNFQNYSEFNINKVLNRNCPLEISYQFQFGCICKNNKFYDQVSNTCVDKCPINTIGLSGVCSKCPQRCQNCQIDSRRITFVSCSNCSSTYTGNSCLIPVSKCQNITNCAKCTKQNQAQICQRCQPFYALSSNKRFCLINCNINEIIVMGNHGQGYCQTIPAPDQASSFISGIYKDKIYLLRKQKTCGTGLKIYRDRCVVSCPTGFEQNRDGRCICPFQFGMFWNETCVRNSQVQRDQLGYYYNLTYNAFLNCPVGCLSCQYDYCLQCAPNYVLVVSALTSVCRQNSLYFSCSVQSYTYFDNPKICMSNRLLRVNNNITNCQIQLRNKCIKCLGNFILSQGSCAAVCGLGFINSNGKCIRQLENCTITKLLTFSEPSIVDYNTLNGPLYKKYSQNQIQISNQPITQILAIRRQLGIQNNQRLTAHIHRPEVVCQFNGSYSNQIIPPPVVPPNVVLDQCNSLRPYVMIDGTCIERCPFGTFPFLLQNQNKLMCLRQTQCYLKDKSKPIRLQNGTCVSVCPQYSTLIFFGGGNLITCQTLTQCQKINKLTPFKLENGQCSSACPPGTYPQMDNLQQLRCKVSTTNEPKRLNIDASVYPLRSFQGGVYRDNLYYFVIDQVVNPNDIVVNYYGHSSRNGPKPMVAQTINDPRGPVNPNEPKTQINPVGPNPRNPTLPPNQNNNIVDISTMNNKTYLAIRTPAEEVVLDLSKNIKQFYGADGRRLSSTFYGVRADEHRIHNTRSWLAIIAYILSIILICLHAVYIGNQLLYKIDNFLIFAQTMYYFSFIHLLINTSIGQFYYGFLWSHFGFFPNYFYPTIPPEYMEGYINQFGYFLPNSYRLLTGDANFIRNAGFSISLLLTFLAAFIVTVVVLLILAKACGKYEVWYKRIAKNALIAAIQFVSMNIFYWAVAHLLFNRYYLFNGHANQPASHVAFRTSCSAASIAFIVIYGVYMIVRFIFDKIGGLYMFKRLTIATILTGSAYLLAGNSQKLLLIPLVFTQILFMVLRFVFEEPYLRRQKVFIVLESVLMIIAYITIYLWNDTGFVSLYVSIVLFFFILLFVGDLLDVYLDNKDQFYQNQVKLAPGLRHKQFLNGQHYLQVSNLASLPDTDRRLKQG